MTRTSPQMRFILLCVLLDMIGIGLAIPVLPELLGQFTATREIQSYWYGVLVAAFGLTQFLAAPVLGALSDRYGRRPVLLASIIGLGLDFVLTGLAGSVWMLLAARILGGATSASFIVANGYAADVSSGEERTKNFGLIGAMMGLGFTVGPLLGGLLGSIDLRLPFYAAAALALVNAIYGALVVPESLPLERRAAALDGRRLNPFSALGEIARRPQLRTYTLLLTLTVFGSMILQATWVLYGEHRFGWGPWQSGLSLLVVGLTATVVQGGLLALAVRRYGEVSVVLAGIASSALAYLAFGLVTSSALMLVVVVANFASFAVAPVLQAMASKAVDEHEQGAVQGAIGSLSSAISVIAPLVGAPLLARTSHLAAADWRIGVAFFLCAALQLAALALAWRRLAPPTTAARAQSGGPAALPL